MDYLGRIHCFVFSDIIKLSPTLLTPAVFLLFISSVLAHECSHRESGKSKSKD